MRLAWLHPDCLNAAWLEPNDHAVYVFDDQQIEADGWGIKRILFVYETLLELPVEIHRGPTVETLATLARSCEGIVTVDSPDPWLRGRIAELRQVASVEVKPGPVFVELDGAVPRNHTGDLKRFSRYWAKAERKLLA